MTDAFARTYPMLTRWVTAHGWIELGDAGQSRSFIRVLDEGGLIWEDGDADVTVDDALRAAEMALETWLREEQGG